MKLLLIKKANLEILAQQPGIQLEYQVGYLKNSGISQGTANRLRISRRNTNFLTWSLPPPLPPPSLYSNEFEQYIAFVGAAGVAGDVTDTTGVQYQSG